MSIPVLIQVSDEVRRLSIAGSVVAAGDFRLKKLLPPLEQAGQKAPVFAKVAQAATKLVESNEKTSAEALLELSTLVNAILYTQGETGLAGEIEAVETIDLGQAQTQASARVLKPLLEALSTTGSGRLEIIKEAHGRGAFRDLRLIGPAVAALDDPYPEIGDFVAENVLPLYGQAILPQLRAKFDQKGRAGHVRRLALMHKLDLEGSHEIVKQALEEGSKEVKLMAIECLGGSRDHLSFLLEQVKSKAKDIRMAVLKALGKSPEVDAVKALCAAIQGSDLELVIEPVRTNMHPAVLKCVLDESQAQCNALLGGKEKDKAKIGKQAERLLRLLECLRDRDDSGTTKFLLHVFHQREALAKVKGEPGGKDIEERLVAIMTTASSQVQHALVEAHATLSEDNLGEAFVAACRSRPPAEAYEMFSPYLTAKVDEKKKRDPAFLKREAIADVLTHSRYWLAHGHPRTPETEAADLVRKLDPRWLDLAVKQQQLELVQALATPGHQGANALLSRSFETQLAKAKQLHELAETLRTMVRVQHPNADDAVISAIRKDATSTYSYGLYWVAHLIPQLPPAAIPKLEALLPTLPEKVIDQILDHVTQLKNKHVQETSIE